GGAGSGFFRGPGPEAPSSHPAGFFPGGGRGGAGGGGFCGGGRRGGVSPPPRGGRRGGGGGGGRGGGPARAAPVAWDRARGRGDVSVYDANQPNRILLQDTIRFVGQDLFFSVQPVPGVPPRVKLAPEKSEKAP